MTSYLATALGVCALTGAAQAGFFSFASDSNPDGPTFVARTVTGLTDGSSLDTSGEVRIDLLYDADEDGPGGAIMIPAAFQFDASIASYTVTSIGGQFLHAWTLAGSYRFVQATGGETIFTATFNNALMVSWSDSANQLGGSASLQANASTDPALAFTYGGVLAGADALDPNFSFTLTGVQTTVGGRVPVIPSGSWLSMWKSEGSWSARAVPAPGSLVLIGAAAAAGYRRRR